jgi:hypothetical protein
MNWQCIPDRPDPTDEEMFGIKKISEANRIDEAYELMIDDKERAKNKND